MVLTNILYILSEFQMDNPNIYIGGSVALMLQEAIPYRVPKDIDIISPERVHIFDIFGIERDKHRRVRQYRFKDLRFELFINPLAEFVEYNWRGFILKLSPINEVFQWKLKEKNIQNEKHLNDINYYNDKIN